MNHDLYFIPLIDQALGNPDARQALRAAFERIRALRQQSAYAQGYWQFEQFMELVAGRRAHDDSLALRSAAIALAAGVTDSDARWRSTALELLAALPTWRFELEQFRSDLRSIHQPAVPKLLLSKDEHEQRVIVLSRKGANESAGPINPGSYTLRLDTGRLLWKATLREADLMWSRASRRHPLKLAAETAGTRAQPTREFSLLGGDLIVRVFAGIEAGRLELGWAGSRNEQR